MVIEKLPCAGEFGFQLVSKFCQNGQHLFRSLEMLEGGTARIYVRAGPAESVDVCKYVSVIVLLDKARTSHFR